MSTPRPELDLVLPVHVGPAFPPPEMTPEQYAEWIEDILHSMKEDGSLLEEIARRPCPGAEPFVLR